MKNIIVIGGQKGGGGKTNIANNLAVLRQMKTGKKVLLVDADEQGSSSSWSARRSQKEDLFPVTTIKKFGDKDFINTIRSLMEDFDDGIIDVGGKNTFELRAAMVIATKIFYPMNSSQDDIDTINFVDLLVNEAKIFNPKLQAFIVPSKVSPITNELPELLALKEELENFGMTKTAIYERVIYRKVRKGGRSIFEVPRKHKDYDEKAILEFTKLYNEVYDIQ
jgi:chromosome partitioning protein